MKLEELRKEIEKEEENTKSSIDEFRDNVNRKERKDYQVNKDSHEDNFIYELQQDLKRDTKGFGNTLFFKITKLFKRIGFLSSFVDYIYIQEEFITGLQNKLGWDNGDEIEYERKRMIIVILLSIILTIFLVFIFLIFINVLGYLIK